MRKKNLDLAAEMGEEVDVTEEQANEARAIVPAPVAPSAPMSVTVADIQAIVTAAVSAAQGGNQQIADIVTQGIAQARKPIPEGTDASNPRISFFNPLGDRDHPRPKLKAEFFIGTKDQKTGAISRNYPFLDDDLSVMEVVGLNTLEPGSYRIKRLDDADLPIDIVAERDSANGSLKRMVIVVPQNIVEKKSHLKNFMPGPLRIVEQVTGINYGAIPLDTLAELMVAHRQGHYTSVAA